MSQQIQHACDQCGVQKGAANHWFAVGFYEIDAEFVVCIARLGNSARLKFSLLSAQEADANVSLPAISTPSLLGTQTFGELCRVGLALTWPVAVAVLLASAGLLLLLLRR